MQHYAPIMEGDIAKKVKLGCLVALVLIVGYFVFFKNKEGLIGGGVTDAVFTSGATQRRLGQEFTQPGQGTPESIYLDNIKSLVPGGLGGKEGLVSGRGEPDFWQISRGLDNYRMQQSDTMKQEAASGTESFAPSVVRQAEDELLRQQLYR